MTEKLEIPEDLRDDYEYAKRCGNGRLIPGHSAVRLIERIARLEQDLSAAKAELQARWEHSDHWRNPETGQVECECCCKWALDYAEMNKSVASRAAQVDALKAPVTAEEIAKPYSGMSNTEFANRFNQTVAARLAAAQGAKEESRGE